MPIATGRHPVTATCPECGGDELIYVDLAAILTVTDEDASLRLRAKSKPVLHTCNDARVDLFVGTDQIETDE